MAPSMAPTVLPTHTAPPLTDFRNLVDPRHAWMNLHRNRIVDNSSKSIHAWRGSTCRPRSTPTKSKSCHPDRLRRSVEGGVGPVAGVSAAWMPRPSPHGRVHGVPRNRTHPAIPQEPRCCRCRCICGCFGCCFGCCRGLCGCRAQPGCDPTFGPGLRRAPRTVRLSALPAPSGHRRAGAWWRCRSRCRDQAGHHRKNAKTR